jgi:hypothetical protein
MKAFGKPRLPLIETEFEDEKDPLEVKKMQTT